MSGYTPTEMMTIAAARMIRDGAMLFVGIGLPSAAERCETGASDGPGALMLPAAAVFTYRRFSEPLTQSIEVAACLL